MESKEIKAVIECLLFISDKPLSLGSLHSLFERVDRRTLLVCLDELKAEYDLQGRAFQLVEIAEGYQLSTRVQYAPWIRKMYKNRASSKLSRAALETLAIIAYRQPVTKAEIEDIRGVSADGVVNALTERKLVRIVGRKEVVGRPLLFGTTKEFLHFFGLKDLTDMPELKELQEILEMDEAGESWDLNPQGELTAKIRSSEEAEPVAASEEDEKAGSEEAEPVAVSEEDEKAGSEEAEPMAASEEDEKAGSEEAEPVAASEEDEKAGSEEAEPVAASQEGEKDGGPA